LLLAGDGVTPERTPVHFGAPGFASGRLGERRGSEVLTLLLGHGPVDRA
jgi:hypothetical protein